MSDYNFEEENIERERGEVALQLHDIITKRLNIDLDINIDEFGQFTKAVSRTRAFSLDNLDSLVDRTSVFLALVEEFKGNTSQLFEFCRSDESTHEALIQLTESHKRTLNNSAVSTREIKNIHPKSLVSRMIGYRIYGSNQQNMGDLYKFFWNMPFLSPLQDAETRESTIITDSDENEILAILERFNLTVSQPNLTKEELLQIYFKHIGNIGVEKMLDMLDLKLKQYEEIGIFTIANSQKQIRNDFELEINTSLLQQYFYDFEKLENASELIYREAERGVTNGLLFLTQQGINEVVRIERIKQHAPVGYKRLSEIINQSDIFSAEDIKILFDVYPGLATKIYADTQRVDKFGNTIPTTSIDSEGNVIDNKPRGIRTYDSASNIENHGLSIIFFNELDINAYLEFKVKVARKVVELSTSSEFGVITYEYKDSFRLPDGTKLNPTTINEMFQVTGVILDLPELLGAEINGIDVRGIQIYDKAKAEQLLPGEEKWEDLIKRYTDFRAANQGKTVKIIYRPNTKDLEIEFNLDFGMDILETKELQMYSTRISTSDYLDQLVKELGIEESFERPKRVVQRSIDSIITQLAKQGIIPPVLDFNRTILIHPKILNALVLPVLRAKFATSEA